MFQCKLCLGLHKTKEDLLTHYGVLHCEDSLQYKVIPLGSEEEEGEADEEDASDVNMESEVEMNSDGAALDETGGVFNFLLTLQVTLFNSFLQL